MSKTEQMHLAQVNIARMRAPIDSPIMADFVNNLDRINALAEDSEGFVWRLKDEVSNDATSISIFGDNFLIVNMSVWENVQCLLDFVYQSDHVEVFKRRKEWFEQMEEKHMANWYIKYGRFPTVEDAVERLEYIRKFGETPYAFSFKSKYTIDDLRKYLNAGENITAVPSTGAV